MKPRPAIERRMRRHAVAATQAQIANAQAGYDCRLALAVLQYQTIGF
jgi:hypothetical protein